MKYKETHRYIDDDLAIAGFGRPYYAYWIEFENGLQVHTHSFKKLTKKDIEKLYEVFKVVKKEK